MRTLSLLTLGTAALGLGAALGVDHAAPPPPKPPADPCARPAPGSALEDPPELRSKNGVLSLQLAVKSFRQSSGATHFCYITPDGKRAPTLRLHPGDLLDLRFSNDLSVPAEIPAAIIDGAKRGDPESITRLRICRARTTPAIDACGSGAMTPTAANLHFHGFSVRPACHQDDVLKTSIEPGDAPLEYQIRIPEDHPAGLYWYHPHIHSFTGTEVTGGAAGAIIIEGIEKANPKLAGLPEHVFVIRDQELLNPDAPPSRFEPRVPKMMIDRDGDAANNGSGFGKPARDLSVNYVPVPYPDYPTAQLKMKPGERQLWRVVNAASVTYLNLSFIYQRKSQPLDVVAIDGVPLAASGSPGPDTITVDRLGIPPAGRAEFVVTGPPAGATGLLVTRFVDTGSGGENDPNRALVTITPSAGAPAPAASLPAQAGPAKPPVRPWLGDVAPVRVRHFIMSEKLENPADPNSATAFYITEAEHTPKLFDPAETTPDITVHQGDVEDWVVENHSTELHDFHIHQLHFLQLALSGQPTGETFLRDTVNVPYFNGRTLSYPSVHLRMDFRDPNIVGTFVFHCHLLDHEDGGMIGTIQVLPAVDAKAAKVGSSGK